MTKVVNDTADYNVVPSILTGPNSLIHPVNFQNIAASQARAYEMLTGNGTDGGAVEAGNTPHVHIEAHNMPFITLFSKQWGNENVNDVADNTPLSVENYTTSVTEEPFVYIPFFVPDGYVNQCILVVLHMEGNAGGLLATLETWSGSPATPTAVTNSSRISFRPKGEHPELADLQGNILWCRLYPATDNAVHSIKITSDILALSGSFQDPMRKQFRSLIGIVEPAWGQIPDDFRKPDRPDANMTDVGDSRNTNAFFCPSDKLFPANGTYPSVVNPGVRALACNDTWLQEKMMGIPAGGQSSATVDGHIHDGVTANGAEIQVPVFATSVGRWSDAAGTPLPHISGNGSVGPEIQSTTPAKVISFEFYTPQSTYEHDNVGHPRLKVATIMRANSTKNANGKTKVTSLPGTGSATTAVCATNTPLTGYELCQGDVALNFTSGGLTPVDVTLETFGGTPSETAALVGICFWVSP